MKIAHAIKGRIRVSVPEIRRNLERGIELEKEFQSLPGVRKAEKNLLAGSILVMYDPDEADLLVDAVEDAFPEISDELQEHVEHLDEPKPQPQIAGEIRNVMSGFDKRIGQATGGLNLRILVPASLFALGMGDLLLTGLKTRPKWHDFFWFALGTFFMLNETSGEHPTNNKKGF